MSVCKVRPCIIGEMPERSNGLPWKGSISERVSRVRIPLSPQILQISFRTQKAVGAKRRLFCIPPNAVSESIFRAPCGFSFANTNSKMIKYVCYQSNLVGIFICLSIQTGNCVNLPKGGLVAHSYPFEFLSI